LPAAIRRLSHATDPFVIETTWIEVLAFSLRQHENLVGYDGRLLSLTQLPPRALGCVGAALGDHPHTPGRMRPSDPFGADQNDR
jgi:hypothetical protein